MACTKKTGGPSPDPEYKLISYENKADALLHIMHYARTVKRAGRGDPVTFNDFIIAADTETSKTRKDVFIKGEYAPGENIIVAWTISIRIPMGNICTVYGHRPTEFCTFIGELVSELEGEKTIIYFHNMAYDLWFLQKFLVKSFGVPVEQLNTKPHYPIKIEFSNGLIFKDSLIIAQKRLEKWAEEFDVEHKKAVGKWDYDTFRNQDQEFTPDELEYIEHDTLALAECLEKLREKLHKHIYSIPITCTAIVRETVRKAGRLNRARNRFERMAPSYELYRYLEAAFHGGYTHANREATRFIWPVSEGKKREKVYCYDFSSSYPFVLLTEKMPCERFRRLPDERMNRKEILGNSDLNAYIVTFRAWGVRLKDPHYPMPVLQFAKCLKCVDPYLDNGRVMAARYIEIIVCDIDLKIIDEQYTFSSHECINVWTARKALLPKWFRDVVYSCYVDKCRLKGGDPVEYALAKARINSLYGMTAQKSTKEDIEQDYTTGDFYIKYWKDEEEKKAFQAADAAGQVRIIEEYNRRKYQDYLNKITTILPYFYGVYTTAAAQRNLFELSECIDTARGGIWLYSDTDSIYATKWDHFKLEGYNDRVKRKIHNAGYSPVKHNDRAFWPGVAEFDGKYLQFKAIRSKCYAVRKMDGTIKITVAGVPKKGAKCLKGDLNRFDEGFIFPGTETGKLTHFYITREDIYIDENGNERGDSIDLHSCDYEISLPKVDDLLKLLEIEEIYMQVYEDE